MGKNLSPPSPLLALRELATPFDLLRSVAASPSLVSCPRGAGEAVMVLPGFGAGDRSTAVLRSFLKRLGYRVEGWGQGVNRGDVEALLPQVAEHVAARSEQLGQPLSLIGWSLGGVLAREAARDLPEQVSRVITLGTPVVGGPRYTAAARFYESRGFDFDALEQQIRERDAQPIRVPVTSIFSKSDGVVAWRATIDPNSYNQVEHIQVAESHLSLGFSAKVYRIIAQRLAEVIELRSEPTPPAVN